MNENDFPTVWVPSSPSGLPEAVKKGASDPGSRAMALVAWVAALVLIVATAVVQQMSAEGPPPAPATGAVAPVEFDEIQLLAKILTKVQEVTGQQDATAAKMYIDGMDGSARSEEARVRVAMVIGATMGSEAALERIDLLEAAPEESAEGGTITTPWGKRGLKIDSPLRQDLEHLREVYEADDGSVLGDAERAALTERHGYYGQLALLQGTKIGDAKRQDVMGGGGVLMAFLVMFGGAVLLALLAGLVMAIIAAVMIAQGKVRRAYVGPSPGGSVPIETVAVFVGGFLVMHFALDLILPLLGLDEGTARTVGLGVQWVLALVIFYPLLRGVSWTETKQMFGLHRGKGVLREIGCGIGGYLAALPLFVLGVVGALVLLLVIQAVKSAMGYPEEPPVRSPLAELFSSATPLTLLVLATLTTIWAPLVEETIFRGALFRQLGTRTAWVWAALLSALAFAAMHQYHPAQLIPIFTLGFVFALLRVWRGSLIASITAHCLHNAFVTVVMVVFVTLLK